MDRELVTTSELQTEHQRVLLQPRPTPARIGPTFQCQCDFRDLEPVLCDASRSKYVAVDFETRGNDYSEPDFGIIGIGLAWDSGSAYFSWAGLSSQHQERLQEFLLNHPGLLAHNVYFDGGVVFAQMGQRHATWAYCTLALYKFLANEGWAGQRHGLKEAMTDILCWEDTNEQELDEWLCLNGYYKGARIQLDTLEGRRVRFDEGKLKPEKGEMWRAPASILGKYCVLDAEACYLLFTEHLAPAMHRFPEFRDTFLPDFMHLILLHIEQKMHGLLIDTTALHTRKEALTRDLSNRIQQFKAHPLVHSHISAIETALLSELALKEPPRYRKQKERPPEPAKYKKDGTPSKNWEKWVRNGEKNSVPVLSKNWENWQERWRQAVSGEDKTYQFNINSDPQVIELLYKRLGFPVRIQTESGQASTSVKAFKQMGEVGAGLVEAAYLGKEQGFLADYIARTKHRPTIHPGFRLPGAKTGRLSSANPNLLQVSKTKQMMSMFLARPGHILVDLDFAALESVVAAELSGDPNLFELYGDGKPENDIHLFIAATAPGLMEPVLATGYRPVNPPAGTVAKAKKEAKAQRTIAKTVVYACQFGASVDRVMQVLEEEDIFLPFEQVELIHSAYWEAFRRLKQYSYELQRQCRRNGGWILNGLGRPMCVPENLKHDTLSRVIQSTGHDILVRYIRILTKGLLHRGIPFKPWVIDWHDATAVEVPEEYLDATIATYMDSLAELNSQLGGTIQLKGTPSYGTTMADIKEPEN